MQWQPAASFLTFMVSTEGGDNYIKIVQIGTVQCRSSGMLHMSFSANLIKYLKEEGIMKKYIMILSVVFLFLVVASPFAFAWNPPKTIFVGGAEGPSATGFQANLGLTTGITEVTGIKFRIIPGENPVALQEVLRWAKVSFALSPAHWVTDAAYGTGDFKSDGWGPQKLRLMWVGGPLQQALLTRGNAGIKTGADIKGKRVAHYLTSAPDKMMRGKLAFFDVTYDDVISTDVPGYSGALKSLQEGAVDVVRASLLSGPCYELEASPHGVYWLPMPASDTEGWKRAQSVVPYIFPSLATRGAGISKSKPLECLEWAYQWVAYESMDDDLVYWFTKQTHECYDAYKDKHKYLGSWTWKQASDVSRALIPYHPGSIRYYKEKGVWGPEKDKWQAKMLAKGEKALADWITANPGLKSKPE